MDILVNGVTRVVPEASTVSHLLEALKIAPERVVVEVNLTILKRTEHARTILKPGDQVEIVHFVGGGSDRQRTADFRPQAEVCCLKSEV